MLRHLSIAALAFTLLPTVAHARDRFSLFFGFGGGDVVVTDRHVDVDLGVRPECAPAPVCHEPAVVVDPAPVVVSAPAVVVESAPIYVEPPVVYLPAPRVYFTPVYHDHYYSHHHYWR